MSIRTDQEPIFTLTTGPVDAYPEVLRGLARPVLYDYDPAFLGFYEKVEQKLRSALRTAAHARDSAGRAGARARGGCGVADRQEGRRAQSRVRRLRSGVRLLGAALLRGIARDPRALRRSHRSGERRGAARGASGHPRRRRLPPRHPVRDHQSGRGDRPDRRRARRLSAGRCGLVVRRHGYRSRFLSCGSVRDRAE
jgi:hypothetical protein